MSLLKKSCEITIDGKEYVMYFDMKSIAVYKEVIGKSFRSGVADLLFKNDDEEILNFIACTLREKENEEEPVGLEVVKENPLFYIMNLSSNVTDIVYDSLPSEDNKKTTKKK